jgi:hypothetical protein
MRVMSIGGLALSGFLTLIAPQSIAQERSPQANDWSVESITVTAQSKGPAYWHATNGKSEVWIIGIVMPIPEDFQWNTSRLSELMKGAHSVLLPPRAAVGLFESGWFLLTKRDLLSLPDGQTLDGVMGPDMAAKFAAARAIVNRDADHYEGDTPALVAMKLEGDFMKSKSMTVDEPVDSIESLARRNGVEVQRVATYDAMPSVEAVLRLPPETSRKCIGAAIADVSYENVHAAIAADDWAIGDVAGVRANYSEPQVFNCLLELSPTVSELDKRAVSDTAIAIENALKGDGRSIAVVSIGQLLRKNGVLERLLADGISVAGPPE